MKRFLVIAMALMLVLGLVACGDDSSKKESADTAGQTEQSAAAKAESENAPEEAQQGEAPAEQEKPEAAAKNELKSDKYTYILSNEPLGTAEYSFDEWEIDAGFNVVGHNVVTRTVYLVPAGTVVNVADESRVLGGEEYLLGGIDGGSENYSSGGGIYTTSDLELTFVGNIYRVGSRPADVEDFSGSADDSGIWLAVVDG